MARYKPNNKPFRYEVALHGKDVYGVFDNTKKRFVKMELTKPQAEAVVTHARGVELDKFLIKALLNIL